MRAKIWPVILLGAAAALLGGCAVLTVDVDVYKGPLANHKDVQMQQAAVMAVSAKPLLIALRDKLECNYINEALPFGRELGLPPLPERKLRTNHWYRAGRIPQKSDNSGPLKSSGAIRVNAILGLYEDRAPEEYQGLLVALRGEYDALLGNLALLRGAGSEDTRFWSVFEKGRRTPEESLAAWGANGPGATDLRNLLAAYREFHVPPNGTFRSPDGIVAISRPLSSRNAMDSLRGPLSLLGLDSGANSTAAGFRLLGDADFVGAEYDLLFRDESKRGAFVARTRKLAAAYADAQAHQRKTLELSLKLMEMLSFAMPNCPVKTDVVDLLARNVVEMVDTSAATKALEKGKVSGGQLPEKDIHLYLGKEPLEASYRLLTELAAHPGSLLADFMRPGLDLWQKRKSVQSRYDTVADLLRGSEFERGRLSQGLDTLVESYLSKEYRLAGIPGDPAKEGLLLEKQRLLDALTHFAQKVLFLANNQALLSQNKHVFGLAYRALFTVAKLTVVDYSSFNDADSFPRVLQAVGNSILVQVDEIRQAASQEDRSIQGAAQEKAALAGAYNLDPRRTLEKRVSALTMEAGALPLDLASHRAETNRLAKEIRSSRQRAKDLDTKYKKLASERAEAGVVNQAKEELDKAQGELANAQKAQQEAESGWQAASRKKLAYDEIIHRTADLDGFLQSEHPANGEAALKSLLERIRADAAKANDPNKQALQDAADLLAARPLPPHAAFDDRVPATDAKAVLDGLISQLRYDYLRAVEDGGAQSPLAVKYAQALDAAYKQRTGMIYIRPASSYLRTSFPATSLQKDASIGWENMLQRHGLRQLPFGSKLENNSNLKTVLEIDKQFWQNVNRVRVAGGGRGNYVVAKDDLGNWYVKNYSSDPKDIIKSAQNLAMFSLGPAIGAKVPLSAVGKNSGANASGGSTAPTRLEFELGKFTQNYSNQTYQTYLQASQQFKKATLNQELTDAWQASSVESAELAKLGEIAAKASTRIIELPDVPKQPDQAAADILKSLRSVREYYLSVQDGIAMRADLSLGDKPSYKAIVREKFEKHLAEFIRARRETAGQYEAGLGVLSDTGK